MLELITVTPTAPVFTSVSSVVPHPLLIILVLIGNVTYCVVGVVIVAVAFAKALGDTIPDFI